MSYVTVAELRAWLGINDGADDALLEQACSSAAAWIDEYCGQSFAVASSATERLFYADSWNVVRVDSIGSTSGLVVKTDDNDDGTAETTWTVTTDYVLLDVNGRTVGTNAGPYRALRAVGDKRWPSSMTGRPLVAITARWGWPATPATVKQAAYELARDAFKSKEVSFGTIGYGDFGVVRTRVSSSILMMLAPYRAPVVA